MSCADQVLTAAAPGNWTIERARLSQRGRRDTIAFEVEPEGGSSAPAAVTATLVERDQVMSRYGVEPPGSGDRALVLAFNESVESGRFRGDVGYRALSEFAVQRRAGLTFAVLGINGEGCFSLSSDGWASGSSSPTEVVVRIAQ